MQWSSNFRSHGKMPDRTRLHPSGSHVVQTSTKPPYARAVTRTEGTTQHLTVAELAERWKRRPEWVQQNARSFFGFKIGREWRFDLADIESYEDRRKSVDPMSMTELSAKRQATKEQRERGSR